MITLSTAFRTRTRTQNRHAHSATRPGPRNGGRVARRGAGAAADFSHRPLPRFSRPGGGRVTAGRRRVFSAAAETGHLRRFDFAAGALPGGADGGRPLAARQRTHRPRRRRHEHQRDAAAPCAARRGGGGFGAGLFPCAGAAGGAPWPCAEAFLPGASGGGGHRAGHFRAGGRRAQSLFCGIARRGRRLPQYFSVSRIGCRRRRGAGRARRHPLCRRRRAATGAGKRCARGKRCLGRGAECRAHAAFCRIPPAHSRAAGRLW